MLFSLEPCEFFELSGVAVASLTHQFYQCELVDQSPVRLQVGWQSVVAYSVAFRICCQFSPVMVDSFS